MSIISKLCEECGTRTILHAHDCSAALPYLREPFLKPDPITMRIRAAIDAQRTGIEVHEGPKPGPICPRCRYDWLLCPCPGEILFNDLEQST